MAKIRPFRDRPEIEQDFLLYSVPDDRPAGPDTVFSDTFYERIDRWVRTEAGTIVGSEKPYFGNMPDTAERPVRGTDDQWLNGFVYDQWVEDPEQTGCCPCHQSPPVRIRQAQTITCPVPYRPWLGQVQSFNYGLGAQLFQAQAFTALTFVGRPAALRQAQALDVRGAVDSRPALRQAQDVTAETVEGHAAALRQAQALDVRGAVDSRPGLRQAQTVTAEAVGGQAAILRQAQRVRAPGAVDALVRIRQAQDCTATAAMGLPIFVRQAQHVTASGAVDARPVVRQAQHVTAFGGLLVPAVAAQAQDIAARGNVDERPVIAQAQDVTTTGGVIVPAFLRQAQALTAQVGPLGGNVYARQAQDVTAEHPDVAPGLSCSGATPIAIAQSILWGTEAFTEQFYVIVSPGPTGYVLKIVVPDSGDVTITVYEGDCAALVELTSGSFTGDYPFTHTDSSDLTVKIESVTGHLTYRFEIL